MTRMPKTFWAVLIFLLLQNFLFAQMNLESEFKQKVKTFFAKRFQVDQNDLRIVYLRLPDFEKFKSGPYQLNCTVQSTRLRLGRQTIWLNLMKGQKVLLKSPVTIDVAIRKKVFVLNENIGFHKALTSNSFRAEEKWLTDGEVFLQAVEQDSEIIGKESVHFLPAGKILLRTDLQQPSVIKPGDEVKIYLTIGQLTITTKGIARSSGGIGDMVTVKNVMTGKRLKGEVRSPGVVVIKQSRSL